MTIQEEIKKHIDAILKAGDMFLNPPEDLAEFIDFMDIKQSRTEQILKYLHSKGVVIKVGEIREIIRGAADSEAYVADGIGVSWERSAPIFGDFKRAGYVAVEPLIKE